jgi:hypothetical protein
MADELENLFETLFGEARLAWAEAESGIVKIKIKLNAPASKGGGGAKDTDKKKKKPKKDANAPRKPTPAYFLYSQARDSDHSPP